MKKVAVVTGSRAEYGLLKPLLQAIRNSDQIQLQLLVTGMHLMPEFGNTYLQIEEDGFTIDTKIDDGLKGDTAKDIAKAVGRATIGFAEAYHTLRPELLVVLGDRSEILAAVTAAVLFNIPVAHIHGGETTEGAYDEFIRHAITKMSHLHFASCEVYRKRIIQLGEYPSTVFNVGAIGIDSIREMNFLDKEEFQRAIDFRLAKHSVLITFHPVTLEKNKAKKQFRSLLKALETLEDTSLIFTKPNSDKDGIVIGEMIDNYVNSKTDKAIAFFSLGQQRYLSALKHVDFVIGNSSSGIIEVPYFKIPTINIGDRQKGRISPDSVIHCNVKTKNIKEAIQKVKSIDFIEKIQTQKQLYGDGYATEKIMEQLIKWDTNSIKKTFYDLKQDDIEQL